MNEVMLKSFPVPISVNAAYANNFGKGRRGRHKSIEYKRFEREAARWAMHNPAVLQRARELSLKLGPGQFFRFDSTFWFQPDSIISRTKSSKPDQFGRKRRPGEPKRHDTSNRIKTLEDTIAALLGIDDCWFWEGSYKKQLLTHPAFPACVDVKLTLVEIDALQADVGRVKIEAKADN